MAGSQFRADLSTMGSGAAHVQQVNAQIQSQLVALLNRLEPLQGQWRSEAASSFQVLKVAWQDNARTLNEALRAIGESLEVNRSNYAASDEVSRQGFTGISAVLG